MATMEKIQKLTQRLMPTGRAFKGPKNGWMDTLNRALSISEARAYDDALATFNSILPDNNNFTADDATDWERRLGIVQSPGVPLADRKAAILRKYNHPGTVKPRQSRLYIEGQLRAAGFDVYVYQNRTPYSGGSGASASATVAAGQVTALNVVTAGIGYLVTPNVTISGGGGVGATAYATTASNGAVTGFVITNPGTGYTSAPSVTITAVTGYVTQNPMSVAGLGGSGAGATATVGAGAVTGITVTSGGTGYLVPPAVIISGGGGTGATATATLSVVSRVINSGGSGYNYLSPPTVVFSGGGGSGAAGYAVVSPSGTNVISIVITNPGSGYTSPPTISFTGGGGSGASATAVMQVDAIAVTAGGSGYTTAPAIALAATNGLTNVQHGDIQHGDGQHGGVWDNICVNHIDEEIDLLFNVGDNLKYTFFIGGDPLGSYAYVPATRKDEFRQLILRLKPVNMAAYLFVVYT